MNRNYEPWQFVELDAFARSSGLPIGYFSSKRRSLYWCAMVSALLLFIVACTV